MAPRVLAAAAALALARAAAAPPPPPLAPYALRLDLTPQQAPHSVFVTLDAVVGLSANLTVAWALPPAFATQAWARLRVSRPTAASGANATVWDSGPQPGGAQLAALPRSALAPATAYDFEVQVGGNASAPGGGALVSGWSVPARGFTSAGAALWAAGSAPVWAPTCGGGSVDSGGGGDGSGDGHGGGGASSTTHHRAEDGTAVVAAASVASAAGAAAPQPPKFALFHAEPRLALPPGATGVLSALLYVTAAPPIYNDPWNVTKLFSGFQLRVNGTLLGLGPGHTACGPFAMSSCEPVQPVDGFDVTSAATAAVAGGEPLVVDLAAYSLPQPAVGTVPAVQALLVVRWAPEGGATPVTLLGTAPGPGGAFVALDADGLFNPSGNKDSGWYEQPREDRVMACLPALPAGAPGAGCPAPWGGCTWAPPAPAPGAFPRVSPVSAGSGAHQPGGTLPLAGKATQAVQVVPALRPVSVAQLAPGRWVLDPGFEMQGGLTLALAPGAPAPSGVRVLVQLGDELLANGSVRWNTRAGMAYQDAWTFPPPGGAGTHAGQRAAAHHEVCEFRYAELVFSDAASGAPLSLGAADFDAGFWRVHYRHDAAADAVVASESPELDAVFRFAAFTVVTTSMDIYSDSNTRQRSFDCMADNGVAALNHYSSTGELALPRMMAAQAMAIGDAGYVSLNWADWTVLPGLAVVNDALYTGDLSLASTLFDALLANHTYAWALDAATGLVTLPGLGALVDTSGGDDDGFVDSKFNAVVQSWCYAALRRFAALGRWLGRAADAAALDATADGLRSAVLARMLNASGTALCDGVCADTPHTSVHSTFYALASGLAGGDAALAAALAGTVRARAAEDPVRGVPCGAYPVQFLLAALYADGADHGNAAFGVLTSTALHSYRHMMEGLGATATLEAWLPEELPNLSFSHVWSSSPGLLVPQFFYGLTPTAPGYATLDVAPQPGPVRSGRAVLPTVRGPVSVAFEQTVPGGPGGCMTVTVGLPGNVLARVLLPRWGAVVPALTLDGVSVSAGVEGDFAVVAGVGAGEHLVTSC